MNNLPNDNDITNNQAPSLDDLNPSVPSANTPESMPVAEAPKSPEAAPTPEIPPVEEKLPSLEDLKSPELQQQPKDRTITPEELATVEVPVNEDTIKDLTDQVTQLHELTQTKDKITQKADDEEEHFIEEVEKHHGNL